MTAHTGKMTGVESGAFTVGAVAEEYGVTVRTLHHYDTLGLLVPSARTAAGYRLYTRGDLERLGTIIVYRRLGFPLAEVAALVDGDGSIVEHLHRQRAAVMARLSEMEDLVSAIDRALENEMTNTPATPQDLKDLFGDAFDETYAAEAEQRWGDTEAWQQSQERTATWTRADWASIKAEGDAINADFVAAFEGGAPAAGERAMAVAERHRRAVEHHYDCSHGFHRHLADLYVDDERYAAYFEKIRPGLAAYVRDAIHANADRHEGVAG
ncbi:MAG: MerR family transcriptional regulator [Propionibacteriaceae bacterium]|nr:MerR family transcriptional regulator [Propionibacteriaceae bacterium]